MIARPARLCQGGRLVIPMAIRKALHLTDGTAVMLEVKGNTLQITPLDERLKAIQAACAPYLGPGSVDELIADRRQEAAREEA